MLKAAVELRPSHLTAAADVYGHFIEAENGRITPLGPGCGRSLPGRSLRCTGEI